MLPRYPQEEELKQPPVEEVTNHCCPPDYSHPSSQQPDLWLLQMGDQAADEHMTAGPGESASDKPCQSAVALFFL